MSGEKMALCCQCYKHTASWSHTPIAGTKLTLGR